MKYKGIPQTQVCDTVCSLNWALEVQSFPLVLLGSGVF